MKNEAVQYHREKNVGIITLNRPERLNTIKPDLLNGLINQLNAAREDGDYLQKVPLEMSRVPSGSVTISTTS